MIHVDFTIAQRDLFRVNLALAKVPLALGCAIGILAVGSLCWFFWLIDEGKILFQLSPLFVGVPLISVAGQVLRLHATCRRFYRTLPDSQRRAQYLFQEIADGYDVIRGGGSFSHILWQDLMQVVELRDYFVIYINQFEPRILLKNGFHDQLDIPLFRRILLSKLGNKAKLLNG